MKDKKDKADKVIWTPVIVSLGNKNIHGYHVNSEKDFRVVIPEKNLFLDFDSKRIVRHRDPGSTMMVSIRPK